MIWLVQPNMANFEIYYNAFYKDLPLVFMYTQYITPIHSCSASITSILVTMF
jgi:hypothetical protein